jgi:hypothetical protein
MNADLTVIRVPAHPLIGRVVTTDRPGKCPCLPRMRPSGVSLGGECRRPAIVSVGIWGKVTCIGAGRQGNLHG